jgi:long-chain acyl-CoA synthetase
MERIELLTSLEEVLHVALPEDFGAEIHTVLDLITGLEQQAGIVPTAGTASRQSWETILARGTGDAEKCLPFDLSGSAVTIFKYICLRLLYYLVFRTLLRLKTQGLNHLPEKGPFLICPNHESYLDAFILLSVLPYRIFRRMFFLGYSVFFKSWFMKPVAHLMSVISVDPDAHLLRAMKAGAAGLRSGLILGIFPEGGRSFDGELQAFKKGAAILSREMSVPIIPAAIRGTHKVWPRDSVRIRPHRVSIEFGQPLFPSQSAAADPYQMDTERLQAAVASLLR